MEPEFKNIRDLSVVDRPREKLARLGPGALSNTELIAIILRSGSSSLPIMTICKNLVESINNNLSTLDLWTTDQIAGVKGIGEIKAVTLMAALELGKRSQQQALPLNLKEETAIENLIRPYITDEPKAQYHLVLINNRDELLATCELETNKKAMPDMRRIMKLSLEAGAAEIMLCRNELKLPSRFCDQEKAFIIKLDAAASMLKIKMRGLLVIEKQQKAK